ncbi:MAG: gluconate 2-dehydrogenase subunit 3 family protein [Betaproteobacteria bacterium]
MSIRGYGDAAAPDPTAPNPAALPMPAAPDRLTFFTPDEVVFVAAAIARLIPSDALGPGAVEAGVTMFIDHQLAGPFGQATDWYMAGPWADGTREQGYQTRRTPAEVYRAAIPAINRHSGTTWNKTFAGLSSGQQDDLLHALEDGELDLGDVSAKTFFTLLWENTQEGFFADPIYLGNRGFAGWKLIGYPGPRYNYDEAIRHYGERYPLPTVGLLGRDPSKRPDRSP